jgi:DNA invertase Pin-like site-specific DNA recombinase
MRRIGYLRRPESGRAEPDRPDSGRDPEADALRVAGCDEVRVESEPRVGGDAFTALNALLDELGPGDLLVTGRLEHLGANGRAMLAVLERLDRRGAGLEIVRPPLSSRGPGGVALRAALEAVAAVEPQAAARPRRAAATQEIRALQRAGVGPVEIARRLGVSRMTVWRKLKAMDGCDA